MYTQTTYLAEPASVYQAVYRELIGEWKSTREEMIPWTLRLDCANFLEMIANLRRLPFDTFWLIQQSMEKEKEQKMLGACNIRYALDEFTARYGGQISFGIRPSERNRGFGCELLRLSLAKASEAGLRRVLITCREDNIYSKKAIQKNGGHFDSSTVCNGHLIDRYWVYTSI